MSPDYVKEISDANAYLMRREGEKPAWLDDFLDSNRCKLVETICRATSVAQGISSLQGYREGYFNEIIQNANDLLKSWIITNKKRCLSTRPCWIYLCFSRYIIITASPINREVK